MSAMSRLHQRTRETRDDIAERLVCLPPNLCAELRDAHWSIRDMLELKQVAIQAIKDHIQATRNRHQ